MSELHRYNPLVGNVPRKGEFLCSCGHTDDIIRSIRRLSEDQLLPIRPYAIEGYCPRCAGDGDGEEETAEEERQRSLFGGKQSRKKRARPDHACPIARNGGKFFRNVTAADLRRIEEATAIWEREKEKLPYPKQEIPLGEKTKSGLLAHHYRYWHQMFHPRQLLCLATIVQVIIAEEDVPTQESGTCQ